MFTRFPQLVQVIFLVFFASASIIWSDASVIVYHGTPGTSRVLKSQDSSVNLSDILIRVKPNTTLTVILPNWNPTLYEYSLSTKIDSSKVALADLSKYSKALSGIFPKTSDNPFGNLHFVLPAPPPAPPTTPTPFENFVNDIQNLQKDILDAESKISNSDALGSTSVASNADPTGGYKNLLDHVKKMKKDPLRFQDPNLKKNIENKIQRLKTATPPPTANEVIVAESYATNLLKSRNDILEALKKPVVGRLTAKIGTYKTKIKIKAKARMKGVSVSRDTSEFITINVVPDYDRHTFEIVPIGIIGSPGKIKQYEIKSDTIRLASEKKRAILSRVGVALLMNFEKRGYPEKDLAIGFGPTLGFFGSDDTLSDFGATLMMSYRDYFRFGVGYGYSRVPTDLKNDNMVDMPVKDGTKLEDALSNEWKRLFYFSLAFTGIPPAQEDKGKKE